MIRLMSLADLFPKILAMSFNMSVLSVENPSWGKNNGQKGPKRA
jgi:hypothetical protein